MSPVSKYWRDVTTNELQPRPWEARSESLSRSSKSSTSAPFLSSVVLHTGVTQCILVSVRKEWKQCDFAPLVSLVEDLNGKRTKANGPQFWNYFWISMILALYPNNWSLRLSQTPFFPFMKISTKRQAVGGFGRKLSLTYIKLPRGSGHWKLSFEAVTSASVRDVSTVWFFRLPARGQKMRLSENQQPPAGCLLKYGSNGTILKGLGLGQWLLHRK